MKLKIDFWNDQQKWQTLARLAKKKRLKLVQLEMKEETYYQPSRNKKDCKGIL